MSETSRKLNGQRKQRLEELRKGPMNTGQIRTGLGIGMPATRVFELREMGYNIRTTMVTVPCRNGQKTKVAMYTLKDAAAIEMRQAA